MRTHQGIRFANVFILLISVSQVFAQTSAPPPIIWSKCFGGSQNDGNDLNNISPPSVQIEPTADGGYLLSSRTASNDGDVTGNHGGRQDIWIAKIDSIGNLVHSSCVGGDSTEYGNIHLTSNGSYFVHGITNSTNGDFSDNHGGTDVFVRKYDSNGNLLWSRCYGGSLDEFGTFYFLNDTTIFICGGTSSSDGDIVNYHGGGSFFGLGDVFILKVDHITGNVLLSNCVGGSDDDGLSKISFSNNRILLFGSTSSSDGDFSNNISGQSQFAARLDQNLQVDTVYYYTLVPGSTFNFTSDGGYISKFQNQNPPQIPGWNGGEDIGIIKYDSLFNQQWQISVGGSGNDFGEVIEYTNGSFLVAGTTNSNNGYFAGNHGSYDAFLLKISNNGNILWSKCYGGSLGDNHVTGSMVGEYLMPWVDTLPNGKFILHNFTESNDGDVSGHHGDVDWWVLQVDSVGNIEWQLPVGGNARENIDPPNRIVTSNGIVYLNSSPSNSGDIIGNNGGLDFVIFKVSYSGQLHWIKCFGTPVNDFRNGQFLRTSNGFVFTDVVSSGGGNTFNYHGGNDLWVVRLGNDPTATSIEDLTDDKVISVYPNPTNDQITVRVESSLIWSNYQITDLHGRVVNSGRLVGEMTIISTKDLSSSIYLLSIGTTERRTIKIFKE